MRWKHPGSAQTTIPSTLGRPSRPYRTSKKATQFSHSQTHRSSVLVLLRRSCTWQTGASDRWANWKYCSWLNCGTTPCFLQTKFEALTAFHKSMITVRYFVALLNHSSCSGIFLVLPFWLYSCIHSCDTTRIMHANAPPKNERGGNNNDENSRAYKKRKKSWTSVFSTMVWPWCCFKVWPS